MIVNLLPFTLCGLSLIFILRPSLASLGCILLLLALGARVKISLVNITWIAMAFFVVYVGGVIVLISYFASLIGSTKLGISKHAPIIIILLLWVTPTPIQGAGYVSVASIIFHPSISIILVCLVGLLVAIIGVVVIARPRAGPLRGH